MERFDRHQTERKIYSIIDILSGSPKPMGARLIARKMKEQGLELSERAVRYHLKLMDERGLTRSVGTRSGRELTALGREELDYALVFDKVGSLLQQTELMSHRTSLDLESRRGQLVVNVSLFTKREFSAAIQAMKETFESRFGISDLVAIATEGMKLGDLTVPKGKTGLATICGGIIPVSLLKAGVVVDSKFVGILQIKNGNPLRFISLFDCSGCTLDPAELFVQAGITDTRGAVAKGTGRVIANFYQIAAFYRAKVQSIISDLKRVGIGGLIQMGKVNEALCGMPVGMYRVGLITFNGLTPVAAAAESGIKTQCLGMHTMIDFQRLTKFESLL